MLTKRRVLGAVSAYAAWQLYQKVSLPHLVRPCALAWMGHAHYSSEYLYLSQRTIFLVEEKEC